MILNCVYTSVISCERKVFSQTVSNIRNSFNSECHYNDPFCSLGEPCRTKIEYSFLNCCLILLIDAILNVWVVVSSQLSNETKLLNFFKNFIWNKFYVTLSVLHFYAVLHQYRSSIHSTLVMIQCLTFGWANSRNIRKAYSDLFYFF